MKTLVKNRVSIMVLSDDTPVKMGEIILIGPGGRYQIHNQDDSHTLYENVTPPEGYKGKRWCYDGTEWTHNLNWRGERLWAANKR